MKKIRGLWIEDQPEIMRAVEEEITQRFNFTFEHAVTISSALRKLKKEDYDYIFVDSLLPIGSTKIVQSEFGINLIEGSEIGRVLLEKIILGELDGQIKTENLRGIIFASAVPLSPTSTRFFEENSEKLLEWPKGQLFSAREAALAVLDEFIHHKVDVKRNEHQSVAVHNLTQKRPPGSDLVKSDESQILERMRLHVHEQNQSLLRQRAILEALGDNQRKFALSDQNVSETQIGYVNAILPKIEGELDAAVDRCSSKRSALEILDKVDDDLKLLRRQVQTGYELGGEKIKRLILEMKVNAKRADSGLSNFLMEVLERVAALESVSFIVSLISKTDHLIEANNSFLKMEGSDAETVTAEVTDIIDSVLLDHSPRAERRNCSIRRFLPEQLKFVMPRRDFENVLNNLLDNAIKHSFQMPSRPSWVDVRASLSDQGDLTISVESWGAKMDENIDVYASAVRDLSSLAPGSGRGLAIVRKICETNKWAYGNSSRRASRDGKLTPVQGREAFLNTFYVIVRSTE